jgi:predicted Zn-dependent protease
MLEIRGTAPQRLALATGFILAAGCATNPATGKSQLMLVSESQEIAMGREADTQVGPAYGIYEDAALERYVAGLGATLAARSERPSLPWSFKVVDDPTVNAFALPGGFIYVTRGLLGHIASEAQLVAVMGHEVGHVTARHSANQLSKRQFAAIGLLAGSLAQPDLADRFGGLAQTGLGLMFLKCGRDQEREADDLGFRYMTRDGYDGGEMVEVFRTFERMSEGDGDRMPGWLSTHPTPEDRIERLASRVAAEHPAKVIVRRDDYLRRLDGLVFGVDPREGFFRGAEFVQPDLAFTLSFPAGFQTQNQKQAVVGQSKAQDAAVELTLATGRSAEEASRQFLAGQGISGQAWRASRINGLPAYEGAFDAASGETVLRGRGAFVEMDGRVFRALGYSAPGRAAAYTDDFAAFARSFRRLTDRRLLSVQPQRLALVTVPEDMTIEQFAVKFPSSVPVKTLAVINQLDDGERLLRGSLAKRVLGNPVQ